MRRILAWGVHLFTACGAVLGAGALVAIARGEWTAAMLAMLGALFIDSVDGMLARRAEVGRHAPRVDGRRLDDIVDYLNYVIVPAVFLVASGLLPHWAWAIPPVLASSYGFSQVNAKTPDDFFLGFPSYWNVLALYAYLLALEPSTCLLITLLLSALVFVPWKWIYPSRLRSGRAPTFALALFGFLAVCWAVLDPDPERSLVAARVSLVFPAWYVLLSLRLGGFHREEAA